MAETTEPLIPAPMKEDKKLSASVENAHKLDAILAFIQDQNWSIGHFLYHAFANPQHGDHRNSSIRTAMISKFLKGNSTIKAQDIVKAMYVNKYSTPKAARTSRNRPASAVKRSDAQEMAQWGLREWAIKIVEEIVDKESKELASKSGGFHLLNREVSWNYLHEFSLESFLVAAEKKGPTFLRLLVAAAIPAHKRPPTTLACSTTQSSMSYASHFSQKTPSGSGKSRRDPLLVSSKSRHCIIGIFLILHEQIVLVAYIMIMNARNLHFTAFQKLVGTWLFAHTAQNSVYDVLGRFGLAVSYTSVLKFLKALSLSAKDVIREKAKTRAFLIIYDNINRMFRAWDPDLAQKDYIHNGTAATYVEIEDCNIDKAFDPQPLKAALDAQKRTALSLEVLYRRVNWQHLNEVMALHCLQFLADECPSLEGTQSFVQLRL